MSVAPDFTSVYSHEWEINFTQCAANGSLKYVDLCNLLQLTAAEHSIRGGLSFSDMQQYNQAWVLSRILVEIDDLPAWQDKVVITTWIESLQDSGSVRNMEMFLNGRKIAGATTLWAVFDTSLRKVGALALPHSHFEKFPDRHSVSKPAGRISILSETETISERRIVLSDLDIVNHVNNVKYLEWCLDAMEKETVLDQKILSIEMNFLRELNYNDSVEIHRAGADGFKITKDEKVCFLLQLKLKQ